MNEDRIYKAIEELVSVSTKMNTKINWSAKVKQTFKTGGS